MQQDGDAGDSHAHTCRRVTDWAGCRWLTTVLAPEGQNGWAQALVLRLVRCVSRHVKTAAITSF